MKRLLVSTFCFINTILFCQVGINTSNPLGVFHVDGSKDNPINNSNLTTSQELNDFIILPNGNVGVGTIDPQAKLDIRSNHTPAFRLKDGSEGADKILVSNAQGVGNWKLFGLYQIKGSLGKGVDLHLDNFNNSSENKVYNSYFQTGSYIELPPGKWLVSLRMPIILSTENASSQETLKYGESIWLKFSFSENAYSNPTNPATENNFMTPKPVPDSNFSFASSENIGGKMYGPGSIDFNSPKIGIAYGQLILVNDSNRTKVFYLIAGDIIKSSNNLKGVIKNAGGYTEGASITALYIN